MGPGACGGASPAGPSAPPSTWPCSSCWGSCTGSRSTAPRPSPAPPCRGVCPQRWIQQVPSGELGPTAGGGRRWGRRRRRGPCLQAQQGPSDAALPIVNLRKRPCLLGPFSGKGLTPSWQPFWAQLRGRPRGLPVAFLSAHPVSFHQLLGGDVICSLRNPDLLSHSFIPQIFTEHLPMLGQWNTVLLLRSSDSADQHDSVDERWLIYEPGGHGLIPRQDICPVRGHFSSEL